MKTKPNSITRSDMKNTQQSNIRYGRSSNPVCGTEDQAAQHHEDKTRPRSVTGDKEGIVRTSFEIPTWQVTTTQQNTARPRT